MYVALARSPRNRFSAPTVPAPVEATNPGRAQHSMIELPSFAAMAVRFNAGGGGTGVEVGEGQAGEVAVDARAESGDDSSRAANTNTADRDDAKSFILVRCGDELERGFLF